MSTVETANPTPAVGASEQTPEVLASAAEGECSLSTSFEIVDTDEIPGRRLYIGNLAYATTEGELKDFFKDYLV
jgi:RNA recognition motif-containing protein